MTDYPFSNFDNYLKALEHSLNTEFYEDDYPEYNKIHELIGYKADIKIVLDFGLNETNSYKFIKTLLNCNRYYHTVIDFIDEILVQIPKINIDFIFNICDNNYEDEIENYNVKGYIIDKLHYLLDINKLSIFKNIKAVYWEDVYKPDIEKNYELACYMYLKHCSMFLKSV